MKITKTKLKEMLHLTNLHKSEKIYNFEGNKHSVNSVLKDIEDFIENNEVEGSDGGFGFDSGSEEKEEHKGVSL